MIKSMKAKIAVIFMVLFMVCGYGMAANTQTSGGASVSGASNLFSLAALQGYNQQFKAQFFSSGGAVALSPKASIYSEAAIQPYFSTNFANLGQGYFSLEEVSGSQDIKVIKNYQINSINLMVISYYAYEDLQKKAITQAQFMQILSNCESAMPSIASEYQTISKLYLSNGSVQNSKNGKIFVEQDDNNQTYSYPYAMFTQQQDVIAAAQKTFNSATPQAYYVNMKSFVLLVEQNFIYYQNFSSSAMQKVTMSQFNINWLLNKTTLIQDTLSLLSQKYNFISGASTLSKPSMPSNISNLREGTYVGLYGDFSEGSELGLLNTYMYNMFKGIKPSNLGFIGAIASSLDVKIVGDALLDYQAGKITQAQFEYVQKNTGSMAAPYINSAILNLNQFENEPTNVINGVSLYSLDSDKTDDFPTYVIPLLKGMLLDTVTIFTSENPQVINNALKQFGAKTVVFNSLANNWSIGKDQFPSSLESFSGVNPNNFKESWLNVSVQDFISSKKTLDFYKSVINQQ